MRKEAIEKLLRAAAEVAPQIEAALGGVRDSGLRQAFAAVIMQRILAELPEAAPGDFAGRIREGRAVSPAPDRVREGGTQDRILSLRADGFFSEPRHIGQVLEELQVRGYHHNKSDVRMSLLRLTRRKMLRRIIYGEGRQRMFYYVSP
ncbi:MAG TPA: hypothetical protein VNL14_03670 [Candidatus Acidoferrales bacterium]|nr:hypothetical protein [Candidatus Acidoferrales bacterium]